MAQSLYRKYRPQVFEDVVGQEHVERTLMNAVATGTVSHAYLFCGPRGTGKTTTARLLAKALLCQKGPGNGPDGTCDECLAIAEGRHPDVYELDAASRTGVDSVRDEIIGRVQFAPTRGQYKIYIIDEVHMLSNSAFNALLKTLEEPPEHVIFILCTTNPQTIPETIQSRCQRFDFQRISVPDIVRNLRDICAKEGFAYDDASLELIAKKASGGMRDAITALERWAVYGNGTVTYDAAEDLYGDVDEDQVFKLVDLIAVRDLAGCFVWVASFARTGSDYMQLVHDLAAHMRNLLVVALTDGRGRIAGVDAEDMKRYREQCEAFGVDRLTRALALLDEAGTSLKQTVDARLAIELLLTRLARPDSDLTLEALAERVEALEAGRVATMPAPAPSHAFEPDASDARKTDDEPVGVDKSTDETPVASASADFAEEPAAEDLVSQTPVNTSEEPAVAGAGTEVPAALQAEPAPAESAAASDVAPAEDEMPVAEAPDTGGELDEGAAQRVWARAFDHIKATAPELTGVFKSVSALPGDDGGIVVEFGPGSSFSLGIAQEPRHREQLDEALRLAAGRPVSCTLRLASEKGPGTRKARHLEDASDVAAQPVAAPAEPEYANEPAPPYSDDFGAGYPDDGDEPPLSGFDLDGAATEPAAPETSRQEGRSEASAPDEGVRLPSSAGERPGSASGGDDGDQTDDAGADLKANVAGTAAVGDAPDPTGSGAGEDDESAELARMLEQGFGVAVQLEEIEPETKGNHVEEEQ